MKIVKIGKNCFKINRLFGSIKVRDTHPGYGATIIAVALFTTQEDAKRMIDCINKNNISPFFPIDWKKLYKFDINYFYKSK